MTHAIVFLALAGVALLVARPWRPYIAIRTGEGVSRRFMTRRAAIRWARGSERHTVTHDRTDGDGVDVVEWEP